MEPIVDWNGRKVLVGDSVVWCSTTGGVLNFGVVLQIDEKDYAYYIYDHKLKHGKHTNKPCRRVKIKTLVTPGADKTTAITTIIEKKHAAFDSITRFEAAGWRLAELVKAERDGIFQNNLTERED